MIMKIDRLIRLTGEQQELADQMRALYLKMQQANMAFALNDNGDVVAYNSEHLDDCEMPDIFGKAPDGYEEVEINDLPPLFPVWVADGLCVRRK